MKRMLKRGLSLLVSLLLVLSLTGCQALDDMKAAQAFWLDNGNILYRDVEYRLLPECDKLNPVADEEIPYVYVTEQDVPVLLSEMFGQRLSVSQDGVLLFDGEEGYYCSVDRYPDVFEAIFSGATLDTYAYTYFDYELFSSRSYVLTDAQKSTLDWVFATQQPLTYSTGSQELYDQYYNYYDYSLTIQACSEDFLFSEDLCDLYVIGDQYYLIQELGVPTAVYPVPEEMRSTLEEIVASYMQAEQVWDE